MKKRKLVLFTVLLAILSCTTLEKTVVYVEVPSNCDENVLSKRIQTLNPKNTITFEYDSNRIRIGLQEANDSICLPKIVTTRGEVYISETYGIEEIIPTLEKINDIVNKTDKNRENNVWSTIFHPYEGQRGPLVGYVLEKHKNTVDSLLGRPDIRALFPNDIAFLWTTDFLKDRNIYELIAIKPSKRMELNNKTVHKTDVQISNNGIPQVLITLTSEYADIWKQITRDNIGGFLAIIIDEQVISYPKVQQEIEGGKLNITGKFQMHEIKEFEAIIMGGVMNKR